MKNFSSENELTLNLVPNITQKTHKKSRSSLQNPIGPSAFGTSGRKFSKFDVIDPLNCSLVTPGPGQYESPASYSHRNEYSMMNFEKIESQYLVQKHYEDSSEKVVFTRKKKEHKENLNNTHSAEPSISFPKSSAERGLWEPNNYYHPYKLPDSKNPGPGAYAKHYTPIKADVSSWTFKSQKEKFDEIVPRRVGPGTYSADTPRKLPNWRHFGSRAQRNCKIKLEDNVIISPSPAAYTPYVPGVPHSSTYVFNSNTKRGCQAFPPESVGPGAYNAQHLTPKPATFNKTDRAKFEYFKGKEGLGPAHYVNNLKIPARSCSFELYSERFFPVDKTGVFLIPEAEDERNDVLVNEKVFVKKRNKIPFNSSVDRDLKTKEFWIKKKVAPDPGFYEVKNLKKLGSKTDKSPRFKNPANGVPGPGEYEVHKSPLKPVTDRSFMNSF